MPDSRPGQIEILSDPECVKLLRSHDLGRIAVVDQEVRPLIFPVNYFFDEGVIVFRTAPGTKLDLVPGANVCFEVDGWDPDQSVGWSVLVKGIAHDITNPRGAPTGRMRFWPVRPVAPGSREHSVGIWANEITGHVLLGSGSPKPVNEFDPDIVPGASNPSPAPVSEFGIS